MSLNTGEIIDDKYRIVRLLGEGGMGAVYEGENTRIHRRVAIKVLHAGIAETADAVQRFEREAQAAGRIGSEHIVEVLDLGNLSSGDRYMVMEFMDGDALSARIEQKGRMTPAELYPIAVQMLEGLKAAHEAGIIHRDLKPDNVYLLKSRSGRTDFVKLLDFGISKFSQLSGDSGFSMTRTGAVMGTPYYMAPEQAKGARGLDHRVDLYAAGVILYEGLTGRVPFNANTFNELLFKIVLEEPPPIEDAVPDLDPNFALIVKKAMAREPEHRFASAEEFRQALDAWAQGSPMGIVLQPNAAAPYGPPPTPAAAGPYGPPPTPIQSGAPQAQPPGNLTPGAWSQSGPELEQSVPPPKKRTGLIVGLVAAALVLGGVGMVVKSGMDSDAEEARLAAERAQEDEQRKQAEAEATKEAERKKELEALAAQAEEARKEAQRAIEDAKKITNSGERAKAEKAAADKTKAADEARAKATQARVAPAPAPGPKTAPAPAPAPPPAPSPEPSSGRKIRTTL